MGDKCEQPCQIVCVSQCFFWTFSVFGLGSFRLSRAPDKKKKKREAGFSFGPLLQDVLSPFFQDGRPENDITHTSIRKKENEDFHRERGGRKVSTVSWLIDVLLHEILITTGLFKTGPGADGDLHTQASFSSPIISSLIFHLVASVNQRIPLMKVSSTLSFWLRCQTDVGIWVGNLKGLACSSGVKGRANYIDKHAWDSSSVRQPFQQRETLSESDRTWIFLFFLLPPHDTFPVWLTDKS